MLYYIKTDFEDSVDINIFSPESNHPRVTIRWRKVNDSSLAWPHVHPSYFTPYEFEQMDKLLDAVRGATEMKDCNPNHVMASLEQKGLAQRVKYDFTKWQWVPHEKGGDDEGSF